MDGNLTKRMIELENTGCTPLDMAEMDRIAAEMDRGGGKPVLPPDPEGMNDQRAAWAGAVLRSLRRSPL